MREMSVKEYQDSAEYRVISILSAYRSIAFLGGVELVKKISSRKNIPESKNFIILVDSGFIQLDNSDVLDYAQYIANAYGYNLQIFYDLLFAVCAKVTFSRSRTENNASLVNAISEITTRMAKIKSIS